MPITSYRSTFNLTEPPNPPGSEDMLNLNGATIAHVWIT